MTKRIKHVGKNPRSGKTGIIFLGILTIMVGLTVFVAQHPQILMQFASCGIQCTGDPNIHYNYPDQISKGDLLTRINWLNLGFSNPGDKYYDLGNNTYQFCHAGSCATYKCTATTCNKCSSDSCGTSQPPPQQPPQQQPAAPPPPGPRPPRCKKDCSGSYNSGGQTISYICKSGKCTYTCIANCNSKTSGSNGNTSTNTSNTQSTQPRKTTDGQGGNYSYTCKGSTCNFHCTGGTCSGHSDITGTGCDSHGKCSNYQSPDYSGSSLGDISSQQAGTYNPNSSSYNSNNPNWRSPEGGGGGNGNGRPNGGGGGNGTGFDRGRPRGGN